MFESLLVGLGAYRLLKMEDCGDLFPTDLFRAPDFRVVLEDGTQWLIEVKNVYEEDPFKQRRRLTTRAYCVQLESYAAATGATLKVAVFWARWAIWTLVSPERLADRNGDLILDMMTAMQVNELGHLGDRSIGTRPPLRLRIATDPGRTSPIAADGTALITIAGAKVFCGDEELIDPVELDFHAARGLGGGCPPKAVIDGHSIQAVEFRWEPIEQSNQGLEFVGALSRMFARYYAAHTIEDREVVQLRAPLRPGWFAPLLQYDHRRHALPLWCIKMQPNFRGLEARRSL